MTELVVGEIVTDADLAELNAPRRRERNVARTPEILPPNVDAKVSALERLDPESQTRAVTAMLSHARTGLLAAIAAQDLRSIMEFKAKAAGIAEVAKQVRLGKEMQLEATEFVRRAERGLGVAIREGQERGEIASRTNNNGGPKSDYVRNGEVVSVDRHLEEKSMSSPTDFAPLHEFTGGTGDRGIYAMTDGVSDDQFEEALAEAKEEGNLSRANVARKAKAKVNPPESTALPDDTEGIDAPATPESPRPFKKSDTEMLAEIAGSLENFSELITWIRPSHVDDAADTIKRARDAWRAINKHLKEIENG
ncbi:hypothetical protein [Tsukamurella sp. USMM236]|uniref:hypothetical protein n=1 Tax=Tsukamurella sp. USMM236 TaxID=3081301 RepID=UPI00301AFDB2